MLLKDYVRTIVLQFIKKIDEVLVLDDLEFGALAKDDTCIIHQEVHIVSGCVVLIFTGVTSM